MKYVFTFACCAMIAVAGYLMMVGGHKPAKFYAVENETKVRPAYFEDMKYQEVEVRAPASNDTPAE